MHLVPFFWRFHNVHHTDLDMDVSTASRFHLGEVLFSIFFRVAVVGLLGLSIWTLAIYELIFSLANQFQHSNWGTVFCWWDHLHRTIRIDVPQDALTIGVAAYRDEAELTFGKLFLLPFRKPRAWQLPDGVVPERPIRPAKQLAP